MLIDNRVSEDFQRAHTKGFWRGVGARILGRDNALLAFEEARRQLRAQGQHYVGFRTIAIDKIVGSVSRYHDFDRAFLPLGTATRNRWQSIDKAYYVDSSVLPPIELYQLGDTYWVKDGNHRVSVAREQGQEFIDAYVIELHVPVPIRSLEDVAEWLCQQDRMQFVSCTRLADVQLTLPGQYEKLLEHIDVHRWFMGTERRRPVSWDEAVESWHVCVYLPVIDAVRESDVLTQFPGRTEGDLYLWLTEHRWFLQQAGVIDEDVPMCELVGDYVAAFSPRLRWRLARLLQLSRSRGAAA
jgi:hypothetical protein